MNTNASERFTIRNAYSMDFESIRSIMKFGKTKYFGKTKRGCRDAGEFFRHYVSHRLLIQKKATGETVGYAEFNMYPHIAAMPKDCWNYWLKHHYCMPSTVHEGNTLFLTNFVYTMANMPHLMIDVLFEILLREFTLKNIIVIEPPVSEALVKKGDFPFYGVIYDFVTTFYPKDFNVNTCKNVTKVHLFNRDDIVFKLRYRMALPQDNDEIIEIIDMSLPELHEELGDFYIAEQLLRSDKNEMTFIIAELNHETVGFMSFNRNVDIMRLIVNFELEAYGNLMKFNPNEPYTETFLPVLSHEAKPIWSLFTKEAVNKMFEKSNKKKLRPSESSVNSQTLANESRPSEHIRTISGREFLAKFAKLDDHLRSMEYYSAIEEHSMSVKVNEPYEIRTNVFALQLFGMHTDVDVRRTFRFMMVGFSAFPERDLCVFSMPLRAKITYCLHEMLKYCVRVMPRPGCVLNDHLFVTHRSCCFSNIALDAVTPADVPLIEKELLAYTHEGGEPDRYATINSSGSSPLFDSPLSEDEIIRQIMNDVLTNEDSEFRFLVVRCGNMALAMDTMIIVGVVIVRPFRSISNCHEHFHLPPLNDWIDFDRAEIILIRVNEQFAFQSDFLFRRLARNLGFWDFWYLMPTKTGRPLCNDLVKEMMPIEPRRIKKCAKQGESPMDRTYAMFEQNLRPKRFFGNKDTIVVIGFTHTARVFLRLMVFRWNSLDFVNVEKHQCVPKPRVTVIARPGVVEAACGPKFECPTCDKRKKTCWVNYENCNAFTRDTIQRMDLRTHILFVSGEVAAINRAEHQVELRNGCQVHYDELLLMCDSNYASPTPPQSEHDVLPSNYAHINNHLDKIVVYHKVDALMRHQAARFRPSILLYGRDLRTFEFVEFLLQHGVAGKYITLAMPYNWQDERALKELNNPYHDRKLEPILVEMVEDLGVHVIDHLNFSHWHCHQKDNSIEYVAFKRHPNNEPKSIYCDLFVSFFEMHLEWRYINVLKDAHMRVVRNNLIVDENFCTIDPKIHAVGRFIEFEQVPNFQYKHVSLLEACQKLMRLMGMKVTEKLSTEVKYSKPCFFRAQLPMNHFVGKITLPKRYLANHLSNEYDNSLTTYKNGTFTRVRLNEHFIVEEILCVTHLEDCFDYLQFFIGKNESLLSNLQLRWYGNEFQCFLEFFQEPWTELVMHDYFDELHAEFIRLSTKAAVSVLDVPGLERKERIQLLKDVADQRGTTKSVEEAFLTYLRKYRKNFKQVITLPEDLPQPPKPWPYTINPRQKLG